MTEQLPIIILYIGYASSILLALTGKLCRYGACEMEIRSTQLSSSSHWASRFLSARNLQLLLLPLVGLYCLMPQQLRAQEVYDPYHPDVKAAATRGIEYLAANSSDDVGEAILAGIAMIEYWKRYEEEVPVDDPLVRHALNKALDAMEARAPLPNKRDLYAPCLAAILFCSVDDKKYAPQIQDILYALENRQNTDGGFGYLGEPLTGDTSQTQYAALALWVAKAHGFDMDTAIGEKCLTWLTNTQQGSGSWFYKLKRVGNAYPANGRTQHTLSIHCAGLSTVYLLGDYLELTPNKKKNNAANQLTGLDLPPSVSIHVAKKNNDRKKVANFDRGRLRASQDAGNRYLANNWTPSIDKWNYYYLYALERYAFFRETAEGSVREIPTWYDQGVEFLFSQQGAEGAWPKGVGVENEYINTAFAVMFLVRASEILVDEGADGLVRGNKGFEPDKPTRFNADGTVTSREAIKGVEDVMTLLKDGGADGDLDLVVEAMTAAISEMAANDDKSRNEQVAFLRELLQHEDYYRRLIAVKLLAGVQDINNAPALIYALGDPAVTVREEAHNGLRLVSRKLDSIQLPENATPADFAALKERWSQWYLGINPGAKLLD